MLSAMDSRETLRFCDNMKKKSKLRVKLGYLKFKTIDTIPYKFLEKKARWMRQQISQMAFSLPPVAHGEKVVSEIHMLCGKDQLDMGVWASWSILRFLKECMLYVHSDGTLGDEDTKRWRKVIPSATFISKEEADAKVANEIAGEFPLLYSWRSVNWCGHQTVDVHLFGNTDRLIVMDSDVLCFKDPIGFRNYLSSSEPAFLWNRDIRTLYSLDVATLNSITGLHLPEALNAGFLMTPRFDRGMFRHLERILKKLKDTETIDLNHWSAAQTYYAMCVPVHGGAALPDGYSVTYGKTKRDTILRHYVGLISIRPRYYLEGVPLLLKQIGCLNSVPRRVRMFDDQQ